MEKVNYSISAQEFLKELIEILFNKHYFSFEVSAQEYVDNLRYDVENYIGVKKHHQTPKRLLRYGKHYATFSGAKRTTWYVFFNKVEDLYIIKHITNNHTATASFIRGL